MGHRKEKPHRSANQNGANKKSMKRVYHRRTPSVKSCANGLFVDTGSITQVMNHSPKRAKRGEITQFSRHARKRLQNALLTLYPPRGWVRFGLCVTVPAQCDDWQDEWLKTVKRFWDYLSRSPVNFAGIYRVELQTRGMPHMHLVMFSDAEHWQLGACYASTAWRESLEALKVDGKSVANGWVNGITAQWQEITYANSFRYLYDHEPQPYPQQDPYHM